MDSKSAVQELVGGVADLSEPLAEFELSFGDDLPTVSFGHVGSALIEKVDSLDDDALRLVFERVERLLGCGDEETETAVSTGFLEAVLNGARGADCHDRIVGHLGPEAQRFARALDEFWEPPAM